MDLVPAVLQSFTSSPSKADTSLRQTVGAGLERVHFRGSWLYKHYILNTLMCQSPFLSLESKLILPFQSHLLPEGNIQVSSRCCCCFHSHFGKDAVVSKANFSYHVTEHAVMDSAVRRNWQLMVGIRVGESSNSPNTIHTFPLCQVERIWSQDLWGHQIWRTYQSVTVWVPQEPFLHVANRAVFTSFVEW